jgi:CBS domain-containing protein
MADNSNHSSDKGENLKRLSDKASASNLSHVPVKTFMEKSNFSIPEGTKIYSAIMMLAAHKVGSAPVVNRLQHIVGVISEHDLLIQTATRDVAAVLEYTKNPMTLKPDSTLLEALAMLYKNKVRRIPVVDPSGLVLGVVTRMHVLSRLIGKSGA